MLLLSSFTDIETAVLQLSEKERWRLADALLGSLPVADGAWTEEEIVSEATPRDDEVEQGREKPLSESQFWAGVRQRRI